MYKIIALDIDGTLLDNKHSIPTENIKAINYAQEKGAFVTLSTGRPIICVDEMIQKLKIVGPVITCNGASVYDSVSKECLYEQNIDAEVALRLIDYAVRRKVSFVVWSKNILYSSKRNADLKMYTDIINIQADIVNEYNEIASNGISKILFIGNPEYLSEIKCEVEPTFSSKLNYFTSQGHFLEFVDIDVSKGKALSKIAEFMDLNSSNVIAIGDGENDIEMIKYASMGVAMQNAKQSVKNIAQYITKSNIENGVAHAIRKFV
jgi:Cof subfamily protein (haloacid dehalogenase superfamily)